MFTLHKALYRFNEIIVKVSTKYFREIKEKYHKIHIESETTPTSQSNAEYKEQSWKHKNI